jgi:hypothetical protein
MRPEGFENPQSSFRQESKRVTYHALLPHPQEKETMPFGPVWGTPASCSQRIGLNPKPWLKIWKA